MLTAVDQGMGTKSIDLPWAAMGVFLDLGDGFILEDFRFGLGVFELMQDVFPGLGSLIEPQEI